MENTTSTMLELFFIPCPAPGHIVSTVEFANRLLSRHPHFQATILLMKSPWNPSSSQQQQQHQEEEEAKVGHDPSSDQKKNSSTNHSNCRLRRVDLQRAELVPPQESPELYFCAYIASHKPQVRAAIDRTTMINSSRMAGIVVDMFCTSMIDVANDLGVPSYLFFTSGAAFLGLFYDLPALNLHSKESGQLEIVTESNTESDFSISTFANPFPSKLIPAPFADKTGYTVFSNLAKRFAETKGIIVNTFPELEPYAVNSLTMMTSNGFIPSVYYVGPILDLQGEAHGNPNSKETDRIMKWLDAQPDSSVVYLCFGSHGTLSEPQVKEIAIGLKESGCSFLWSLRKPPIENKPWDPRDYTDTELKKLLPTNFLSILEDGRRGLVCDWTPQVEVLAHKAVGAFVSHCGWNSTLESFWFGVPIVTWPLSAEQHSNAFLLVKELGLSVELRIDYRREKGDMATADEIQKAVSCVMDQDNQVRNKVKEISKDSKRALMDDSGSYIDCLIRDIELNLTV